MNESASRFGLFLAELRRRHVGRVAIAYGAVAFVLLQAGEIVLPAFAAPDWVLRLLVLVTFLGFPVPGRLKDHQPGQLARFHRL